LKHMTHTLLALFMLGAIAHPPSRFFAEQPARTIEIHARRFEFDPSEITLKKGEPVTLRLISDDVTHSLVVRDLKINQEMKKDHPADITVTPASAGDFKGECGHFCGSGHGKMKFTVHVTE
jgi:cytochrome c oxidase subunit II